MNYVQLYMPVLLTLLGLEECCSNFVTKDKKDFVKTFCYMADQIPLKACS